MTIHKNTFPKATVFFQALVYVSTAYANSNRTHSDELLYEKPGSEEDLVAVLKMSDQDAEATTQK